MQWHSVPLFVYGTLKQGQPNYAVIQDAVEKSEVLFIGTAVTVDNWPLIVYKPFNTPFLLDGKGIGKPIFGEIYKVSSNMLAVLDDFEGHPYCYTRDKIDVRVTPQPNGKLHSFTAGDVVTCDTYLMRDYRQEVLTSEPLIENYAERPDCRYVLHKDRPLGMSSSFYLKRNSDEV